MTRAIDIEDLLNWAFHDERVESTREPPGDALTLYWAVMALPDPFGSLVRHYARMARAPGWLPDTEAKVIHLVVARHERERYGQWHRALVVLQRTVNGTLTGVTATGPSAPAEPWHEARRAASYTRIRAL